MAAGRDGAYLLYDFLLLLAVLLALPWTALRSLISAPYRRALRSRLGYVDPVTGAPPRLLLHGVSVGEVKAMRPLIEAIRGRHPDALLIVSSTTPGGRQTARRLFPELAVVAYPVDLPGSCKRFLRRLRPAAVVLMELEIWPNFLRACSRLGVPVAIVNGRITERSMSGYLRVQRLLPQFDRIALYGVQNEMYAERFRSLQLPEDAVVVTGNMKYDALPVPGDESAFDASPWPTWVAGRDAIACGSTHPPEEVQLLSGAAAMPALDAVLWLVVPRHPERAPRLQRELRAVAGDRPVLLRSEAPEDRPLPDGAVLVVDSFGELDGAYRAARLAFVGGSLIPHGGQNILEPAMLGVPILVGPHTTNFSDEVQLLEEAGGLRHAEDPGGLLELAVQWLARPSEAEAAGRAALDALAARRGAATTTLEALEKAGFLP